MTRVPYLSVVPDPADDAAAGRCTRRRGSRCTDDYRPATDIAVDVRADIRAAVNAGELPGRPVTYSVTCDTYSMGQSITVTIRGWEGPSTREVADPDRPGWSGTAMLPEAQRVYQYLAKLLASYNWDGSDVQTDYFDILFSGSVHFESAWDVAERARKAARRQQLKAQPKAAKRDKAGLAAHLGGHHNIRTRGAKFDTLAFWHARLHDTGAVAVAVAGTVHPRHTDHPYAAYGAAR